MSGHRGGLLELVARGKKDAFFTSNPKASFFHSVYRKTAAFTEEVYLTAPRNNPEWGRWFEFEIEHRGDLVRKFFLRLQIPTWLPEEIAAANPTSVVTDASGVSYGYCNNVGFQVIDKIQVYQDQVLLQELYGEYLDWKLRQSTATTTALVLGGAIGSRAESVAAISRSATPGTLRIPIPFIGWEHVGDVGFPTVALRNQRFRIRILLRPIESVVVASDGRLDAQPWGSVLRIQRSAGGAQESFESLSYESVSRGRMVAFLETTQAYVTGDVQEWLKLGKWQIPFRSAQQLEFQVADNQMNAATTATANFSLSFPLDFTGAASRLFIALQGAGARRAGQRTVLLPTSAVRQMRIVIANIDRIQGFAPVVFTDVTAYWKNVRAAQNLADPDAVEPVYSIVFGGKESAQPAGTLNFSRALIPSLSVLFGPVDIDSRTGSRELFVVTYLETFNIWSIEGGRGRVVLND
jgi:hypothetical protein